VISSIEITRFRGIREGKLEDLTPLTILVGPNGCGKSSVLDAMLIGGSRTIGQAIGEAVIRHGGLEFGAPWLLWRKGIPGPCKIAIHTNYATNTAAGIGEYVREIKLELAKQANGQHAVSAASQDTSVNRTFDPDVTTVFFTRGNDYSVRNEAVCLISLKEFPGTRAVQAKRPQVDKPLYQLLDEARTQGVLRTVVEIVQGVVPGAKELAIGVEGDIPLSYLDYGDHAVPVALCGDGVYSLVLLSLELATYPDGTVLLEEPEVHQHPGAIRQTIRAILAAVRRDIQVVLTTHSLELIDLLLMESSAEDLERLSVYRLELNDGVLSSFRMCGPHVRYRSGV